MNNTLVFVKRSLNLSKILAGVGVGLAGLGIFVIFALSLLAGSSSAAVFVLPVSFMSLGLLIFATPVTFFTFMIRTTVCWSICFLLVGIKAISSSNT